MVLIFPLVSRGTQPARGCSRAPKSRHKYRRCEHAALQPDGCLFPMRNTSWQVAVGRAAWGLVRLIRGFLPMHEMEGDAPGSLWEAGDDTCHPNGEGGGESAPGKGSSAGAGEGVYRAGVLSGGVMGYSGGRMERGCKGCGVSPGGYTERFQPVTGQPRRRARASGCYSAPQPLGFRVNTFCN